MVMIKIIGVLFFLLATGYSQVIAPTTISTTTDEIDPSTIKPSDAPPVDFQELMNTP